jgi:hypothetical protein
VLVIPGEPVLGTFEQLRGVSLKRCQVVERVDAIKSVGVNKAHEQVTDVGSVFGFKEEGTFAMKDGPFEDLLAEVIIQP